MKNSTRWRMSALACLMIPLLGALGCTSDQEKATRVLQGAIAECQQAEAPFAEIMLFNNKKELVLRDACALPLGEVTLTDGIHAQAMQGPYVWRSSQDDEGIWVLSGVDWPEIANAHRAVKESKPPLDVMEGGIKNLEIADAAVPNSAWIKLNRLQLLLDAEALRRRSQPAPVADIGDPARAYYTTLTGPDSSPAIAAEARLRVVRHLRDYVERVELGLENLGGMDDWLIKSIDEAKRAKNKADVDKYTAELKERQEQRARDQQMLEQRLVAVKAKLCEEAPKLSADGVEDEKLRDQINAAKSAVSCS